MQHHIVIISLHLKCWKYKIKLFLSVLFAPAFTNHTCMYSTLSFSNEKFECILHLRITNKFRNVNGKTQWSTRLGVQTDILQKYTEINSTSSFFTCFSSSHIFNVYQSKRDKQKRKTPIENRVGLALHSTYSLSYSVCMYNKQWIHVVQTQ